jgi:hypothetical protein
MGPPLREFKVLLPIGHTDAAGQVHRQATIRKMRGHEEALLYDPSLSAAQLVSGLIRGCLVQLGDLKTIDADLVSQLYTADRNYLLLEIRRVTLGDRLQASYLCPSCGSNVTVVEDLSQLEVRRLEEGQTLADIALDLEDGYVDREGAVHTELTLTLPRGIDEEFVAPMAEKDAMKAQDALVLRCIRRFGTLSKAALEAYGVKILRDLTLGDRRTIDRALNGGAPGVELARQIACPRCGRSFTTLLDMTHFFGLG